MNLIRSLIYRLFALRGNFSVRGGHTPGSEKSTAHPKVKLVEQCQYYLWEIKNHRRIENKKTIYENLAFLEGCRENWCEFIRDVPEDELWNLRVSVAGGLDAHYRRLNKITLANTEKYIENELKRKESEEYRESHAQGLDEGKP